MSIPDRVRRVVTDRSRALTRHPLNWPADDRRNCHPGHRRSPQAGRKVTTCRRYQLRDTNGDTTRRETIGATTSTPGPTTRPDMQNSETGEHLSAGDPVAPVANRDRLHSCRPLLSRCIIRRGGNENRGMVFVSCLSFSFSASFSGAQAQSMPVEIRRITHTPNISTIATPKTAASPTANNTTARQRLITAQSPRTHIEPLTGISSGGSWGLDPPVFSECRLSW